MNYIQNALSIKYNKILIVSMIASSILLASLIFINSKASVSVTPSGYTTSVGGPGGNETGLVGCPLGTIAIGMEGKDVTQVDAVREGYGYLSDYATRCGTFKVDNLTKAVTITYDSTTAQVSGFIQASRTPTPKIVDCPSDSVLVGYSGFQKFNASHNTTLVNALKPRCSKLTFDTTTNLLVLGTAIDSGVEYLATAPAAGSDPIAKADCAANSVVTGFEGRVGELFDLFKLACGTINQSSLSVSIAGPNNADYIVIATDTTGMETELTHKNPSILIPGVYNLSLKNINTGVESENFVCDSTIVTAQSPYQIEVKNNLAYSCTIEPQLVTPNKLPEPLPATTYAPNIAQNTTPIVTAAPAITTGTATPVTTTTQTPVVAAATVDKTIPPAVVSTVPAIQITTRTGGLYVSIISLLIICVTSVLIYIKMKRKN